ncbi:MAG TPA: GPR endopeptidase [Candidatus Protoclostridium stercorigallinarum]|uniref:GPR endopeptidase n=1 Tax=Candidatus Protoclostridium stercorigallinarum TaxID=2838741 RepID=A0A9D1Q0P8_9FIRM|nr:GPR endopeptidase [Candidatus Protoclostridium stercorigallinarum]
MKNFPRTDLASEFAGVSRTRFDGVCRISETVLDAAAAERYGRRKGRYITVETSAVTDGDGDARRRAAEAVAGALRDLADDCSRVLVAGLGNTQMTADALGAETCNALRTGGGVMCVTPGVPGITGIESYDVVKGVCERVRPTLVIAVDSLAAAATSRLGTVIQLCDAGITPGSGVSNHKRPLTRETLGAQVIGVGIPLVVYASTIIREAGGDDEGCDSLIVTPKEVDIYVKDAAELLAGAIERLRPFM